APQGNRKSHQGHAREPRSRQGRSRGSREATRSPEPPGARRGTLEKIEGRTRAARGRIARAELPLGQRGTGFAPAGAARGRNGVGRQAGRTTPPRSRNRNGPRSTPAAHRSDERGAGQGL